MIEFPYYFSSFTKQPIRTASILGSGYIELPPKPLSQESQLMATFITKKATGIILVGLGKGAEKRRRRQAHLVGIWAFLFD